jgi:hypothetical protein
MSLDLAGDAVVERIVPSRSIDASGGTHSRRAIGNHTSAITLCGTGAAVCAGLGQARRLDVQE